MANYFLFFFIGQASKQFDYNIVTFFQFSKDNEQLTQKQISPLRSQVRSLIWFSFLHRFFVEKKLVFFFCLHSLGVILDQFFVPEFHVSVDCTFKEIVMIIIISKGLNLEQMIKIGFALLFTIHAGDVQFAGIKVDFVLEKNYNSDFFFTQLILNSYSTLLNVLNLLDQEEHLWVIEQDYIE